MQLAGWTPTKSGSASLTTVRNWMTVLQWNRGDGTYAENAHYAGLRTRSGTGRSCFWTWTSMG